jgi:NitT/TauT family transport system permease protein
LIFPAILVILELATRWRFINPVLLPPPSVIATHLYEATIDGTLPGHLLASGQRAILGFLLAAGIGIAVGLLVGWFRKVELYIGALLELLRQLPPLGVYPALVFILGFGLSSKVALVFMAAVWPILINTVSGTREVDPLLVKAARSFGITNPRLFASVVIPSAVPYVFSGLRLGATYSVLMLVGAEMIGASDGIGFYILNSQYSFKIADMYAGLVVLALIGTTLNVVLVSVEHRLSRWKEG